MSPKLSGKPKYAKIALFRQSLAILFFTILKWMLGMLLLAFILWWALPVDWRIKYAAEYAVGIGKIAMEQKPHNCDWDSAPLGSKHCHYEPVVTVYNQYGHVIKAQGLGKTDLPSDLNADKVRVEWERVED
jgi:hypothetical protein